MMERAAPPPYKAFGELLTQLRLRAGFAQQSDLASRAKTSQQTVSRWELGVSRPRSKQMPLLAGILKADVEELLALAGYTTSTAVANFDHPFPIEALNPDSFERFCFYFLEHKYPDAEVHRAGGQGHTQEGLDVDVTVAHGTHYTFQCKRVNEFGPAKVRLAVASHTRFAAKKHILLSRVASPQAREAVREYENWHIWDKEDISRIIRQDLAPEQQRQLVDTFFRGQRLALLGVTERGPWQTLEEFFAPFASGPKAFSHQWQLVGRDTETTAIAAALSNPATRAIFLVGPGGSGKSRILKQVVEDFSQTHRSVLTRFLSPSAEVTNESLENLGRGLKLLIVDDAHDLPDLSLLFQYAATPENHATLLLSFRPYGLDHIKSQASRFALLDECVKTEVSRLLLPQATQLAEQVLGTFGGSLADAENIARLTRDCPLATVISAQVVAQSDVPPEFVTNEDVFRGTLMGKFEDAITGNIGSKGDTESLKQLLKVLALVQPFHPEDESITQVVAQVGGLRPSDTHRLIRLLTDAGVLFKRGNQFRISPDLLADYIIEKACIGVTGKSTGYAEQVFDSASDRQIECILLNLGRLDWRRANGDPSNSQLLDGIWQKLKPSKDHADPHIRAVTAVAYYQSERALVFAEDLIRKGKGLRGLPTLIKYAAYSLDHLPRACAYLWELGQSDDRELHQHPGHAIRILSELCAVAPDRPIQHNAAVVDFCLFLIGDDTSWGRAYTPLDVLRGILQTVGHTTTSNGRTLSFGSFLVAFPAVSSLRAKVIDAVIALLTHTDSRVGVLAAQFLHESLRYPMGIFNMSIPDEVHDVWTDEFVKTLEKIEVAAKTCSLAPLVLIELIHSVSWHAHYAGDKTALIARRISTLLPPSLEFRTTLALVDGYGHHLPYKDYEQHERDRNQQLVKLTSDLVLAYPDGENLRAFLENTLGIIDRSASTGRASPFVLYGHLLQASDTLGRATVQNALDQPQPRTKQFAGAALATLLSKNRACGIEIARQFLETAPPDLHMAVGQAYSTFDPKQDGYGEEEVGLLRGILLSKNAGVVRAAIDAIRTVENNNSALAIELLRCVDLSISSQVADSALVLFQENTKSLFGLLTEEDAAYFLRKLMPLPELDGYWIESFLALVSKDHPLKAAGFFLARVEHAVKTDNWSYRPCNYGPYVHVPLRFRESAEFALLVRLVWQWIQSHAVTDPLFEHRASELFDAMFRPFDSELLEFIQGWIDVSTPADMRILSQILHRVPSNLVFEQRVFTARFLEKAKQHGPETLESAIAALYGSAITGVRSGVPGDPFPQDIAMRDEAQKALQETPQFAPAYRLYAALKKDADRAIDSSLRDREAFEDA